MLKLSIITVNLNNKNYLSNTIESILSQSFTNYELIIIDGGSTDGSIEIIKQYDKNISYWISEPDSGIYNAMNKGILKAKAEYCFFLNSGDYLADNGVLEKVFINNPVEDIIFGNIFVVRKNKIVGKAFGKDSLTFSDIYSHTVKHQGSFIKRSLFEKFGFYNEERRIVADWEFFIKTLGLGNVSYRFINLFISYFDNDGISNHNPEITNREREQIIRENIPLLMQPDFEYLYQYKKYEKVYKNSLFFFLIRILNKLTQ